MLNILKINICANQQLTNIMRKNTKPNSNMCSLNKSTIDHKFVN